MSDRNVSSPQIFAQQAIEAISTTEATRLHYGTRIGFF